MIRSEAATWGEFGTLLDSLTSLELAPERMDHEEKAH